MLSKKGFTLVESLYVITIMTVMTLLSVNTHLFSINVDNHLNTISLFLLEAKRGIISDDKSPMKSELQPGDFSCHKDTTSKTRCQVFGQTIFPTFPLLNGFFKNMKANEGIRIDKCNYSF